MIIILIAVFLKLTLNPSKLISQQQAQIKLEQDRQNDQPGRAVIMVAAKEWTLLMNGAN